MIEEKGEENELLDNRNHKKVLWQDRMDGFVDGVSGSLARVLLSNGP